MNDQEMEHAIRSLIRNHSSPTIGRGAVHDGQDGYILFEPGVAFVVAGIRRLLQKSRET